MSDTQKPPERRRSILAASLFALAAEAALLGLGAWQVERLSWKTALIERIDVRSKAPPRPLPPSIVWPEYAAGDHEYERVSVRGTFESDREALIYRGSGAVTGGLSQPGYWVMVPLRLADGARVLVNRGFIPLDRKDPSTRAGGAADANVEITGLVRAGEQRSYFTPPDNPSKGEWFTRDPLAIAAALKLERAAPFSIDEDARVAAAGQPAGAATVIDIPNNHLSYAVTWFGLAATLAGVFAAFVFRRGR